MYGILLVALMIVVFLFAPAGISKEGLKSLLGYFSFIGVVGFGILSFYRSL